MSTQIILIIEDDQDTRNFIARYLRENSFDVGTASRGREMDRYLAQSRADPIVLDLMLPGEDGLSRCCRVRVDSSMPIIILTAKGNDVDRILSLEMGAGDHLPKPFKPRRLLARINAVLRRQTVGSSGAASASTRLKFEGWIIDLRLRELRDPEGAGSTHKRPIRPPAIVLRATRANPAPRHTSEHDPWTDGPLYGRSIDVLVSRLRAKLNRIEGRSVIKTVRTSGYIFMPRVDEA